MNTVEKPACLASDSKLMIVPKIKHMPFEPFPLAFWALPLVTDSHLAFGSTDQDFTQ